MTGPSASTGVLLRRLMRDHGEDDLEQLFSPGHVLMQLDARAARKPQGQLLFSFAVNVLARLYPVIQRLEVVLPPTVPSTVTHPRWNAEHFGEHVRRFLEELRPPLEWVVQSESQSVPQVALIVGNQAPEAEHRLYVGANGWEVIVSPTSPVPTGPLLNVVGAYAAACMGVGEVWKRLLAPHRHLFPGRPIMPLEDTLRFSTYTYRSDGPGDENPPMPRDVDLGRLTMVGLGAGGGAAAYALASLPSVKGHITVVEPDEVNIPNLNRYVFASAGDAEARRLKTDVGSNLFGRHPDLGIVVVSKPFREAIETFPIEDLRYVVGAVHSREARRDLQLETPEVLWDAGATEEGDFRIWRTAFGRTECMFCKHPVGEGDPERDEANQLAELLGFSPEMWLEMLRDNRSFRAEEIVGLSERRKHLDLEFDLPNVGERYGDWYRDQCGRLHLPERDQEVPIPFAPVMAGVLLAGEVIKDRLFPAAVLPHYYGNTMVGSWMRRVIPQVRPPRGDCKVCGDPDFVAQFERRWKDG